MHDSLMWRRWVILNYIDISLKDTELINTNKSSIGGFPSLVEARGGIFHECKIVLVTKSIGTLMYQCNMRMGNPIDRGPSIQITDVTRDLQL